MKRLLQTLLAAGSSRAMPPVVIGLFFLIYIGIAFFTDETLITLMAFTRRSFIIAALLALIPLNSLLRLLKETGRHLKIRSVLHGKNADCMAELFDETVTLPLPTAPDPRSPTPEAVAVPASHSFAELEGRLAAEGYKTRRSENALAAWRGASIFPARILFLAGTLCLFAGILISITTRTSQRLMVIEGEQLPTPEGTGGMVERITLANASGSILSRTLTMTIAPANSGQGKRSFGLYPPALYGGSFVYPRYLGLAVLLRFSAPDIPAPYAAHSFLNCYPPGKEDSVLIPGSPYKIVFSIPEPDAGIDRYISYMTGRVTFQFKLLKGKELLFAGVTQGGEEFERDGYRLALPDIRRLVVTDYIRDYGVLLIWAVALLFTSAACLWLPIRAFFPRREMLFRYEPEAIKACSRAEGGARRHAGVFHEALDLVAAGRIEITAM